MAPSGVVGWSDAPPAPAATVVSSRTVAVATLLALAYLMLRAVPFVLGV
jgi:hypothetical protein